MNILISAIYSFNSYSRGIMPDILQTQIDRNPGANIYYLTNSNTFDVCYFNINKRPEICYKCKTGIKNTLKLVKGSYEHLRISDLTNEEDYLKANLYYENKEFVSFDQVFEGFEVGAATLSTYISSTRDRDLTEVGQPFVKELAVNALALYIATKRFLKEKDIQLVYNFNGRQDYVRAILRASLAANLDCYNVERARVGGYLEFYKNVLPHTILAKKEHVENCWNGSEYSKKKRIEIGSRFFKRQKGGESVIFPSYVRMQQKDSIPSEILNDKRNIVLYNSSDDEFAALGEEFQNPLFKNQLEGIKYLVELFGVRCTNFNLIIRMHPNLAGVNYDYVNQIKKLHQKFPNIFVVLPESKIDSYALMEQADKVISFGSTLGLEATYHGKASILLGKCFYYYSGVTYNPSNKEDIEKLITQPLQSLPQINAIKFGFYYLNGGVKAKYYYEKDFMEGVYLKGQKIHYYTITQRIIAKLIQQIYHYGGWRVKI